MTYQGSSYSPHIKLTGQIERDVNEHLIRALVSVLIYSINTPDINLMYISMRSRNLLKLVSVFKSF